MSPPTVHRPPSAVNWRHETGTALRAYFYSGWAFLVPYLAVYLLYYWQRWPANPATSSHSAGEQWTIVPCLLHVYWVLHAVHIVLATIALHSWWRTAVQSPPTGASSTAEPSTVVRSQSTVCRSALRAVAPWLLLTLIFAIPGVYLEWPSDPWEHLRRIGQWQSQQYVYDHPAGYKAFYFFIYSIVSVYRQLDSTGLTTCYALLSLLLAWQFLRLARATGLEPQWAFIFVVLNCLVFGNSAFSYYRYYGLSTSIIAQISVVAFTRLLLSEMRSPRPTFTRIEILRLLRSLAVAGLLLVLIAGSHIQGFALCAILFTALILWRIAGRAKQLSLLLLILVLTNIAVLVWWPRNPNVKSMLVPDGWFTWMFGFNPAPDSSAGTRMLAIVGVPGLIDIALGLLLMVRSHPVGWLTVAPLVALIQPATGIPLANFLLEKGPKEILLFHRLLLAIPIGLATITLLAKIPIASRNPWKFGLPLVLVAALVSINPGHPSYCRLWSLVSVAPIDEGLIPETNNIVKAVGMLPQDFTILIASRPSTFIADVYFSKQDSGPEGREFVPASTTLTETLKQIASFGPSTRAEPQSHDFRPKDWIPIAGSKPETLPDSKFSTVDAPSGIRNPAGKRTEAFSREFIPISSHVDYWLEMTTRSVTPESVRTLLAVIWYNEGRQLLIAHKSAPLGAGAPAGWSNGSYSYFGLIDQPSPAVETTYRISMGPQGIAQIPENARYIRIGGILNQGLSPKGQVEISKVRFWQRHHEDMVLPGTFRRDSWLILPLGRSTTFSPGSQAGRISAHWNPYRLDVDLAGIPEIERMIRESAATSWIHALDVR